MYKQLLKDSIGWGIILWLIGYFLGFVFFFVIPSSLIGWIITPIGTIITLVVLFKKVKGETLKYYFILSITWTIIAVVFDYLFILKTLKPADGYYKLDVYLYYMLTFIFPLLTGLIKNKNKLPKQEERSKNQILN